MKTNKLVNDTIKIEALVQALQDLMEAKAIHDNARDSYEGYSWGYFGRHLIDKVENSAFIFQTLLNDVIESKVKEIILNYGKDI